MMWKASKEGLAEFEVIDLRDYGVGARRQVDDTPYGGGDGMLLMIEPLTRALAVAKKQLGEPARVVLMSPSRRLWTQAEAQRFANSGENYIFICGRYEGVDARILEYVDDVISVGEYVVTGGELPALTVIDSIVRLIPGVLGGAQSAEIESYSDPAYLEFPQYTRPEDFHGLKVPPVLLSGDHAEIACWRAENRQ
jgi:tRNA (guanine37-N1)-methyltransferase